MPEIQSLTVTVARKACANYQTREAGYSVTLHPLEGEDPRKLVDTWTTRLQQAVDLALGDSGAPGSFSAGRGGEGTSNL